MKRNNFLSFFFLFIFFLNLHNVIKTANAWCSFFLINELSLKAGYDDDDYIRRIIFILIEFF